MTLPLYYHHCLDLSFSFSERHTTRTAGKSNVQESMALLQALAWKCMVFRLGG